MKAKQSQNDLKKIRKDAEQRLETMRTFRYSWWMTWGEISDYMLPRRYKYFIVNNQVNRGSYINQKIIDSTVIKCIRDLAAGMMSGVINQSSQWFNLSLLNSQIANDPDVKVWLTQCRDIMMTVMAESNFYQACHTAFGDLCVFGTAPIIIYEDYDDVINCYNPCPGEYFLGSSAKFQVNRLGREFTMTCDEVVEEYDEENCSPTVVNNVRTNQGGFEVTICHLMEPNPKYVEGKKGSFKYQEIYWEKGCGQEYCLRYRGFHEWPAPTPRWDVVSNDDYGRGPGMDALGDVKQLYSEQKTKAQGIQKGVNPPLKAPISLKNQPASSIAGGITYMNNSDLEYGLSPIYKAEINLADIKEDIAEVQNRIKAIFYNDLFLMISELEGDGRTATEINERKQEKLIMLGPVVERIQKEMMDISVDRIFSICARANLFPPAPKMAHGITIKPKYESMFTEAQKAVSTTGIEQLYTMVGELAGVDSNIIEDMDFSYGIRKYGDYLSVDPLLFKNPKVVAAILAAKQKQAQAQQAIASAQQMAQGAQTLSQTNVGGGSNALQMMLGGIPGGAPQQQGAPQ